MLTLPNVDPSTKVVNEVLQPYFNAIRDEIRSLSDSHRHKALSEYRVYLEQEAQNAPKTVRMQIRINLASLLNKFDYHGPCEEINVRPKRDGLRVLYDNLRQRLTEEETGFGVSLIVGE